MKLHEHKLTGCSPIPLASYLKSLGILRLVAEHEEADPTATGWWSGDVFRLRTTLDEEK
jgi:CRISPR-associated protein Csx17